MKPILQNLSDANGKTDGWVAANDEGDMIWEEDYVVIWANECDADGVLPPENSPLCNRMRKRGWRVRPIKIVFLDNPTESDREQYERLKKKFEGEK